MEEECTLTCSQQPTTITNWLSSAPKCSTPDEGDELLVHVDGQQVPFPVDLTHIPTWAVAEILLETKFGRGEFSTATQTGHRLIPTQQTWKSVIMNHCRCYHGSLHSTNDGPAQVDASLTSPLRRLFADEVAPLYFTKGVDITATCIKQHQYEMQIKTAIKDAVFGAFKADPLC
jgi:hypothetical protein